MDFNEFQLIQINYQTNTEINDNKCEIPIKMILPFILSRIYSPSKRWTNLSRAIFTFIDNSLRSSFPPQLLMVSEAWLRELFCPRRPFFSVGSFIIAHEAKRLCITGCRRRSRTIPEHHTENNYDNLPFALVHHFTTLHLISFSSTFFRSIDI